MNLSRSLKVALAYRDMNQTQLAKKMQVSQPYINSLCSGKRQIGMNMLPKICEALKYKESEFIALGEE